MALNSPSDVGTQGAETAGTGAARAASPTSPRLDPSAPLLSPAIDNGSPDDPRYDRVQIESANSPLNIENESIDSADETRRASPVNPDAQDLPVNPGVENGHVNAEVHHGMQHGVYWRSPFMMVLTLSLGIGVCLGHHFFYNSLRGLAADPGRQQIYLRIGNTFARLADLLLAASIWIVYSQWLWLSLARGNTTDQMPENRGRNAANNPNTTTLRVLDVATSVQSSAISLLHFWLFKNLEIAYIIASVAWCLQIPSLITPSTLFVIPSKNVTDIQMVPVLDINNPALNSSFAYDSPMYPNSTKDSSSLKFVGARTIVLTIAEATASSARIQDIDPPVNNSSYQGYWTQFNAPYVSCQDANDSQTQVINATVNSIMGIREDDYMEWINAYTAFIPIYGGPFDDLNTNVTTTVNVNGTNMTALWDANLQTPLISSTNEIWMRFYRYPTNSTGQYTGPDEEPSGASQLHFLTCQLYNATYNVSFSWNNGVQSAVNSTVTLGPIVPYPNDTFDHPSDVIAHAYSAVFLVLANQLVGTMAFYNNTDTNDTNYTDPPTVSSWTSQILQTSLTGSDDLDFFFNENKNMYLNNPPYPLSNQRLQDKAVARNQTLDLLIPELSFNITVSLLHNPLLSKLVPVNCTHSNEGNQYDYAQSTLLTAYGLAIGVAIAANLLGTWAYRQNGGAFDHAFSTIVSVTRGRHLDNLFPPCCHGVQPLPEDSLAAPLLVNVTTQGRRPGRNIVLARDVEPVCPVCTAQARSRRPSLWARPLVSMAGRRRSLATGRPPSSPFLRARPSYSPRLPPNNDIPD